MGKPWVITINNECEQCGSKTSMFSIDRPHKGESKQEIRAFAVKQQKRHIASLHKGHTYKLSVKDSDE